VTPLLALIDVDGTLFLTDDPLAREALIASLRELYAVDPPADAVERVDHRGQTTLRIARAVLRAEGLDDPAIDEQLARACALFGERYLELLEGADTRHWRAAPGAAEALSRLSESGVRLALLTGNPEPVARARMARLGLKTFFPPGQGAFGCGAEERRQLVEIARSRAGDWPAERTVEVGDTRRDVTSAHCAGVRAIAIRSSGSEDEFPRVDAVCDDLAGVADVLLAWSR
jgi:phosphoglycolate phosphatase